MDFLIGIMVCVGLILLLAKGQQGIVTHKFDWIWEKKR